MALLKLKCPECNAGLKSATGFTPGQTVCCPKCETYFAVEEPNEEEDEVEETPKAGKGKDAPAKKTVKAAVADDDEGEEDEKPKKKKKKKRKAEDDEDAEEGSYKNSPLRFVILGVLVLIMIVLGVMLYLKKRGEAAAANNTPTNPEPEPIVRPQPAPIGGQPKGENPKLPKGGNPKLPVAGKGPGTGGLAAGAVDGLLGGGVPPAQAEKLTKKFTAALVGAWSADLGDATETLTYTADGTFTASRTGNGPATATGKYMVTGLVGTKGLKLQLDSASGARTITVTFEDDELLHPSLKPGVTATFRKKS